MIQAILFLAAALIFVPIAVRLGLGAVLGYLAAGLAIGPFGLQLVSDPAAILHVSELGVVLMLFVIGLELEPRRLWAMRAAVFGGGTLQMLLCAAVLFPFGLLLGWRWQAALVGSLALALSSTAIAVAIMQERNLMPLSVGRSAFSMLLYQDIAAIPLLALAGALGVAQAGAHSNVSPWLQLGAVAGVILAGRFLAYPLMRFVAAMQVRELFTGCALLLVLGVAALMEKVGLSMGLGAFLAGVLLASSEYRHALEVDIQPFKGLLLGLFFIAVGMSMDLALLASQPLQVALGLSLVLLGKTGALWLTARLLGIEGRQRMLLALLLSQVGEFAFVVIATARSAQVLPAQDASLLTLIAALSMASTPLLLIVFDRWCKGSSEARPPDAIENEFAPVIVAGFGRYGQTVARVLLAAGVKPVVIDHGADTVDSARRFGFKVYFGDACSHDILHAAGIEHARAIVLALDDREQINHLAPWLRQHYPDLQIIARARDAMHNMELAEIGVHDIQREVLESSLKSARATLEVLGFDRFQAKTMADKFRRNSYRFLREMAAYRHNENDLAKRLKTAREHFERDMLAELARQDTRQATAGWQEEAGTDKK
ncbi:monovalent cation:proton antiporter-2 (CPA2) family protein [Massilia sp. W12]|uniref:monovalent cation:proton antiporter-2 (CPA2) family protein n=1 Tax=Massilia sp. W12 TaxID=3126507 RepID=UPI0030CD5FA0